MFFVRFLAVVVDPVKVVKIQLITTATSSSVRTKMLLLTL